MRETLATLAQKYHISTKHYAIALPIIHGLEPDLVIAPDGKPYLYRWHLIPRNKTGNVYFHLQVADDPKRPPHDHPWDNQSVILAGGYMEYFEDPRRPFSEGYRQLQAGDVVQRVAEEAHRLRLLPGRRYSMSLFTTGPHRREWGFWYPEGWVSAKEVCVETKDGERFVSTHSQP